MKNTIRILSTSDVHGCIYPSSYADRKTHDTGLAKLKTLVDSLRDENTVLIDNGDTIEGTPFTFYHYSKHPNEICEISEVMRMMGYDYINLGNHDFNYGEKALFDHIEASGAVCLCANVLYKGELLGPEYVIREFHGKKLALFGLVTHFVPRWENPENIADFTFLDAYETALRVVERIKKEEAPDYIICIYHGGLERDMKTGELTGPDTGENQGYRILENIEGISALIGGHQHQIAEGRLFDAVYTQPGFDGMYLSCIDINTDTDEVTARLIPADSEPDQEVLEHCQAKENEVQKWLDTPLGTCELDLKIRDELDCRLHKSQLATFINLIQKEYTGADLSATAIFRGASGLDHEITVRNIVTTYLFPNTLMVKRITGRILKEYLEKCATFWTVKEGKIIISPTHDYPTYQYHNYDMLDGVVYTIKVSNPAGSRITELTRNGMPVKEDDEFTVVLNNYRGIGGGNFEMLKDAPLESEILRSVIDIIVEYISTHRHIVFEEQNNIKVVI